MLIAETIKCRQATQRLGQPGTSSCPVPALPVLDGHQAILSLFERGDLVHRFVARRGTVRSLPPLSRVVLDSHVVKARDELELGELPPGDSLGPLKQQLTRVHRLLLGDAAPHLRGVTRLLVLPHGLSTTLPFHALIRDGGSEPHSPRPGPRGRRWRFLAEELAIAYSPCLAWATRPAAPATRAVVVAPTYHGTGPSPGAELEAAGIATRHPGATILTGARATPARLLAEIAKPGAAVHFAGHGLADLTPGSSTELLFPDGETVSAQAILARRAAAPLLVLAACTTAYAARFRDGKRLTAQSNLAEALLAAGAPAVVAASWNVKDRQSQRLIESFYHHLPREGPVAALTLAYRRAIAMTRPPHPRFWAPYAVFGAWSWGPTR